MAGVIFLAALSLAGATHVASFAQHELAPPGIPPSIMAEHDEMHAALGALTAVWGKTGAAAREVERVLAPHLAKEEEYALPPLGLLRPLASGTLTREMHATSRITSRLKRELPRMLAEHEAIAKALETLESAARAEGHDGGVQFVREVRLHAHNEEEVLYPAAILVGEYLALKRRPRRAR